jgi:hypothetical protein
MCPFPQILWVPGVFEVTALRPATVHGTLAAGSTRIPYIWGSCPAQTQDVAHGLLVAAVERKGEGSYAGCSRSSASNAVCQLEQPGQVLSDPDRPGQPRRRAFLRSQSALGSRAANHQESIDTKGTQHIQQEGSARLGERCTPGLGVMGTRVQTNHPLFLMTRSGCVVAFGGFEVGSLPHSNLSKPI